MASYYVNDNAQYTGEHEVHRSDCSYLPADRTYLGEHSTCWSAVAAARNVYDSVDGCFWCSNACHSR